ncbi:MAG: diacylglycerol kinase family protein [Pseudomonadota bacterium]
MDASRTAFLINPKSHRVAQHGAWLERVGRSDVNVMQIIDFASLRDDLEELAKDGAETFFIEGGDGTLLAILSACADLKDTFPTSLRFAILPGGSTNLAYKITGFKARNAKHLKTRIEALFESGQARVEFQRALHVDCESFGAPQVGFLLSTGTLSRAMSYVQREFHGNGHRGSFAVAKAVLRFLAAPMKYLDHDNLPVVRGSQLSFRAGSITYEGDHCLSLTTCFPRLSLGLNPFWGAESGDMSMTYAGWPVESFSRGLLRALFWKKPQKLREAGFHSHRVNKMSLLASDPIMIDGETYETSGGEVTVSLTEPIGFLR